jgi:zinc transport system permease protein
MLNNFILYILLAGVGLSIIAGPIGSFLIWRRLAFFGDTLAHSALSGIAVSILFNQDPLWGTITIPAFMAILLTVAQKSRWLPLDSWLAITAHGFLALGLVALSTLNQNINLDAYLFGDVLSIGSDDLIKLYIICTFVIAVLAFIWKRLISITVDEDLAVVSGLNVRLYHFIFMVLIAALIAVAIKVVGVMLITSILIIPAATARRFATSPEMMAVLASLFAVLSFAVGTYGSFTFDLPAAPAIVLAAIVLFTITGFFTFFQKKPRY